MKIKNSKILFLLIFFPLEFGFTQIKIIKDKANPPIKLKEGDWIAKFWDSTNQKLFTSKVTIKNSKNCTGDIYSITRNREFIEMRSFFDYDTSIYFSQNQDTVGYVYGHLKKINEIFLKGEVRTDSGQEFEAELIFDKENSKDLIIEEYSVSFSLSPIWEDGQELFPDSSRIIKADLIKDFFSSNYYICYAPLPPKVPSDQFYFSKYYLYSWDLEVRKKTIAIPLVDHNGIFKTVFPIEGLLKTNVDNSAFWIFDDNNQAGVSFLKEKNAVLK